MKPNKANMESKNRILMESRGHRKTLKETGTEER
jgi:hypothetical protein